MVIIITISSFYYSIIIELITFHPVSAHIYPLLVTITRVILPTRWHERFFSSKVHNRIPSDVTFIDTRYDFSPSMVHPIGAEAGKASRWRVRSLTITTIFFMPLFPRLLLRPFLSKPAFETRYRRRRVRRRICEHERRGNVHQSPPLNPSILSGALSRLCFQVAKSR